jgi:hypothetical protein
VSECNREASIMRRPWPTRGYCAGVRIQVGARDCIYKTVLAGSWAHPATCCVYTGGVKVKNEWNCTSAPHICLSFDYKMTPKFREPGRPGNVSAQKLLLAIFNYLGYAVVTMGRCDLLLPRCCVRSTSSTTTTPTSRLCGRP